MSTTILKISRIGVRLPAPLLHKYHVVDSMILEEKPEEIVLRLRRKTRQKLSWAETAKAMAAAKEDWSEWDSAAGDGVDGD